MADPGALDRLRVLEWCVGTAAAYTGKLLSDLGADVVKIEGPAGDPARFFGPFPPGNATAETSGRFVYLNTGKQSVQLNEGSAGRDRLGDLLAAADVVITDDSVDPNELNGLPTETVWCSITPFGLTGPCAGFKGSHLTVFHSGGEGHLLPTGRGFELFPDRPPTQLGSDIGDYDTGANAAVAILAACFRQRDRGLGERIDVSAQESQLTLNRTRLSRFHHDGVELRRGPSQYGVGGMIGCRDGYIQLVGIRDEHWQRLSALPSGAVFAQALKAAEAEADPVSRDSVLAEALQGWCSSQPAREAAATLARAGCAVGVHATPAGLVASTQLAQRSFFQRVRQHGIGLVTLPGVPYRMSKTPATIRPAPRLGSGEGFPARQKPYCPPISAASTPPRPLEGIRILDFTWAAAGPYATLLLALLGAQVIKVESGRRLDLARRGFMADYGGVNRSPNFDELNLNKRSLQVDLTHPAGADLIRRLVAVSDVVVDNFRPGVMARHRLDAASLLAEHPGLVVASSSANGSTGPEAAGAGFASVFGATGGLSGQTGYPDGPPSEVGESTDYRSANALAVAILAALIHRQRTGEGQAIDLASSEVVIATAPDALLAHVLGADWQPRIGNDHRYMSPHGLYPCDGADEWIALAITSEDDWRALCDLLGRPDWARVFPTAAARLRERIIIDRVISEWTAAKTPQNAFLELQRHGLTAAPSWTNRQLATDEHLTARGVFVDVEHPEIGRHKVMRAPWIMAETDVVIHRHGPLLGQDNAYVLEQVLGIPADDHAQYQEALR